MKNTSVIESWANGEKATGSNLRTDGSALWSYDLVIGYRNAKGHTTLYNYRGGHSVSKTTSRHVGQAVKHADKIVTPHSK